MANVLKITNLSKYYGDTMVLDNVNLQIKQGDIYGLIGNNGAGKTTIMKIITGLQTPSHGTYELFVTPYNSKEIARQRRRINASLEGCSFYPSFSAYDNLVIAFKTFGLPIADKEIKSLLELVGLADTGKLHAEYFSLGMARRLELAIALVSRPDFLILDEPTNGLDPEGIIFLRELILKLNKENKITFLISSHNLDELSKVATTYGFIKKGSLIKEITKDKLNEILREKIIIKTNNITKMVSILVRENYEYEVVDKKTIIVYDVKNVTNLVILLSKNGVDILSLEENKENLETYYLNLMGGQDA